MISLITGLPGSGKTSLMVHMLMTRSDLQNRPLFVDGIPELKIPHQPVPEGESMETWHLWAPTGAILVIDEAQRIFRPRPAGSKVPQYIQELETHRHKGIDIFVLTQHPRLIDINLRSLIGEHRNISKTMLGIKRISYWQRCANPEARSDISEAKNSVFTTKKSAFGMYKSAEEHNKISGKFSLWIYVLPISIMFVAYLIFSLNQRHQKRIDPKTTEQTAQQITLPDAQQQPAQSQYFADASSSVQNHFASAPERKRLSTDDFKPDIEGQPWTAPIYDTLNRNIQTMPFPVVCVKSKTTCTCYTDQATPIKEMDKALCTDFAENGIYNPYLKIETDVNSQPTISQEPEKPQILQLGGNPLPSLTENNAKSLENIQ